MKQTTQQFPTEEVTLPSKGLLYLKDSPLSKGVIEMKYMTAREEDILTNQNLIENGTVIDKLLESLIITPINYNELLVGDKNAILVAARILGYGKDYTFNHLDGEKTIDLTEVKDKEIDESLIKGGKNEFNFTLPTSKTNITFKILTHGDEQAIDRELKGLKRLNKNISYDLSTRMKYVITSVEGDYETKTIRDFVDNKLLARDSRELRNYVKEIQPDINLTFEYEGKNGDLKTTSIPIGLQFFWPDAEL
tara:strand:+ start:901 stop:1650 length:750 start_codon:yes stop_codon:yes gene_type:complete